MESVEPNQNHLKLDVHPCKLLAGFDLEALPTSSTVMYWNILA